MNAIKLEEIKKFLCSLPKDKKIQWHLWAKEINHTEDSENLLELFKKQLKYVSLPTVETETGKGKKKKKTKLFSQNELYDYLMEYGIDLTEEDKTVLTEWENRKEVTDKGEDEQKYSSWQEKLKTERLFAEEDMLGKMPDKYMQVLYCFAEECIANLCKKSERFAAQYLSGGSLKDAVKSITVELEKNKALTISDTEFYVRLAKFYWPEMKIAMRLIFMEPDSDKRKLAKIPEEGRDKLEKPVEFTTLKTLAKEEEQRKAKQKCSSSSDSKAKPEKVEPKEEKKEAEQISLFSM